MARYCRDEHTIFKNILPLSCTFGRGKAQHLPAKAAAGWQPRRSRAGSCGGKGFSSSVSPLRTGITGRRRKRLRRGESPWGWNLACPTTTPTQGHHARRTPASPRAATENRQRVLASRCHHRYASPRRQGRWLSPNSQARGMSFVPRAQRNTYSKVFLSLNPAADSVRSHGSVPLTHL